MFILPLLQSAKKDFSPPSFKAGKLQMEAPTLDNLWNYHKHFYDQISENQKNKFTFEDLAGIFEQNGQSRLFAICTRHTETDGIKILPQGNYLCADCTEENRGIKIKQLYETAKTEYKAIPEFTI